MSVPRRYPDAVQDRARELRGGGLTYSEIAARLGVSKHAIARWCDPQRRERARQATARWNRANAPEWCARHKRPAHGSGGECFECRRERGRVRMVLASRWWNEGVSGAEIAARLGMTLGSLYQLVEQGRTAGFPFSYRKRLRTQKHREQEVAA